MARQITLELLADSTKFESGMKNAAKAADTGAEKIEAAAKKADRMSGALDKTGDAADRSESKFMGLSDVASGLGDLFGIEALGPVAALGLGMADLTGGFAQLAPVMSGAIDKIKNLSIVTKAQSIAQGALNLVMSLNPIFLVVAAVAALVAIFVVAYKNSETFRDIVDGAFRTVRGVIEGVFNWVRDHWPLLLAILTGPIGIAVHQIITHWDTIKNAFSAVKNWIGDRIGEIVGFFSGLGGRVTGAAGDFLRSIRDQAESAKEWIFGKVNQIVGFFLSIPSRIANVGRDILSRLIPDLPGSGIISSAIRAIPGFAAGGVVPGPLGAPMLAMVHGGETVVPPGGSAGGTVNIYASSLDPATCATLVARALDEYESRNGPRYARA